MHRAITERARSFFCLLIASWSVSDAASNAQPLTATKVDYNYVSRLFNRWRTSYDRVRTTISNRARFSTTCSVCSRARQGKNVCTVLLPNERDLSFAYLLLRGPSMTPPRLQTHQQRLRLPTSFPSLCVRPNPGRPCVFER